jgi:hypothetical protein
VPARHAPLLESRMAEIIGHHLERMAACGQVDRRNGTCARWLLTAFGMAQLPRARTRTFRTLRVVQRCAGSGGPTSQGALPSTPIDSIARRSVSLTVKKEPLGRMGGSHMKCNPISSGPGSDVLPFGN